MTPQALYQQAIGEAQAGRFEAAAAAAARLTLASPKEASGWALLGQLRMQLGDAEAAVAAYERALALRPRHAPTHVNHGAALGKLERFEAALAAFDRALALDAQLAPAHANRAETLNSLSRFEEAQAAAEAAIALRADYGNAWAHLGAAWFGRERFDEALAAYRQAAAVGAPDGWCDVGMTLTAMARWDEARAALDQAVAHGRDTALARYRRGHVLLTLGDFGAGWDEYEERWRTELFTRRSVGMVTPAARARLTVRPQPQDLAGRRVLAVGEQGIGDEIMFASLIPELTAIAAQVTLVCEPRLAGLFRHSFPGVEVIAAIPGQDPPLDGFDRVVAAGSLGYAFRRDRAAFAGRPYLSPRPEIVAAWGERLGPRAGRRRIGVSWRGGTPRTGLANRSLRIEDLAPLLRLPNCEFVSLQYGDVAADLAAAGSCPLTVFPEAEIDDFEQLAGLVANLDLVVSVQTALIHLTGALGRPCYVMIPKKPEWRYMAAGETMPWYGSVRLFRQGAGEAWPDVVARVAEAAA